MGQACGLGSNNGKQIDQKVNDMLRDDRLNDSEIKLLLLGAGESGKSTLFKVCCC